MNKRTLHLGVAWVGLVGAGVGVGIWPAWRNLSNAGTSIHRAKTALAAAADGPMLLQRRTDAIEQIRAFSTHNTKPIPVDGDVAGFVRGLVTYLDNAGVAEREISTGTPARENDVWAAPMTLAMTADFQDIYDTVAYIENLPRLVRVSRLRITRQSTGLLRAELSLDVLFTGKDAAVASAQGGPQ